MLKLVSGFHLKENLTNVISMEFEFYVNIEEQSRNIVHFKDVNN